MQIKIWGCRGSLPSPLSPQVVQERISKAIEGFLMAGHNHASQIPGFLSTLSTPDVGGYGGNTTCVEVKTQNHKIFIDGGSGIRLAGYDLMSGPVAKGKGDVHILFTHFHWDHLIGLPFFIPLFIPGNNIHVYSVQPDLKTAFETIFKKPYFPVSIDKLGAKIHYHTLEPRKPYKIGDIQVTPYQLDHPDPCWGFRVENEGKVYSHCFDNECTRFTEADLGPDLPLYQNVDLMLFDAQYTLMEAIERVNWGHASATLGIDLALREKIKRILFVHHDPASSDQKVSMVEDETRKYYNSKVAEYKRDKKTMPQFQWEFAREAMIIQL